MKLSLTTAEKLRQLRVTRKISQQTLAEALFVKNTTISNWEKGNRQIDLPSLKAICIYFGVPLDYFSDTQTNQGIFFTKQNTKTIIAISAVVALVVSGVMLALNTPNNLNNLACFGEENCYLIDDPNLVTEMNSRNLTGGSMTNIEMDRVIALLANYKQPTPPSMTATHLYASYWAKANQEVIYSHTGDANITHANVYEYLRNYQPDIWWQTFIDLATINAEYKQVFSISPFAGASVVIYKFAEEVYKYEIWTNQIDIFTIDVARQRLYLNNELVMKETWITDAILQSYIESIHTYDNWVDINGDRYGWMQLDSQWHLSYNFDNFLFNDQSVPSKYHRFRIFNINADRFYYMEIFRTTTYELRKSYINIYAYFHQDSEDNRIVLLESEINIDTILLLKDFMPRLKEPNVFISTEFFVLNETGFNQFLQDLANHSNLPELLVDLSDAIVPERFE